MNKFKRIIFSATTSCFLSSTVFAAGSSGGAGDHAAPPPAPTPGAGNVVKTAAIKSQDAAQSNGPEGTGEVSAPAVPAGPPTLYGMAMAGVIFSDNPPHSHTYRGILWYQPPKWIWNKLNVYVAGSFAHWWTNGTPVYRALNIYAIAPVLRYYFVKMKYFSPYIEASVGPGYLTRTQFGNRNLGMHFTFQDELGLGAVAGKEAGFYATASILHYSNAHFSEHNSGITMPFMLTVGYQFN